MKRILKYSILVITCLFCLNIVSACGKKKENITPPAKVLPEVQVSVASKYFDENVLPMLNVQCEYAGRIKWTEDQTIESGSKSYSWKFTPLDLDKFEIVEGEINLIKVDKYVNGAGLPSAWNDSQLQDNKTYVFENCVFTDAVSSTKKLNLIFEGCTFNAGDTGIGGYKCMYLTSITNLFVNNCSFQGTTSAGSISASGYALDLNIYSTTVENVIITNNTFNTSYNGDQPNVAISIKTRLGSTDKPNEDFWHGETQGFISGKVLIKGNAFGESCNNIYLGTSSKQPVGSDPITNYTTGQFDCEFAENINNINIYLRHTSPSTVNPEIIFAGETRAFNNKVVAE